MQLPKRVTLELTNRCNRSCLGCPRHEMTYPLGDITPQLFTHILQQLPASTVIVPFFRGESIMHPSFPMLMNMLKDYREVQLATNADYLTPTNQQTILDTCTFISVSLHNYLLPKETELPSFFYKALGTNVTTQVSILDTFLSSKKKRFTEEWLRHVDRVRIYKTHSDDGFGSMKDEKTPTEACVKPFEEMVVYWDGKVGLCNHDWNNGTSLGDLNRESVRDVWKGKAYRKVRKLHREGRRGEVASCRDCSFQSGQIYGELIRNG